MPRTSWTPAASAALYNIRQWSDGYVDVADTGHLIMRPRREEGGAVDLPALAAKLTTQGLKLPVLVRFTDVLRDRVDTLNDAFAGVIENLGYHGRYTAVYPIKTNQQAAVVEALVAHACRTDGPPRIGLEAGSKPELAAVLGLAPAGALIVCNGYKDREYIRRALIGTLLGHTVHIVVEKLSELPLVLDAARDLHVKPSIGLRIRLSARFSSSQQNTGGEKSKFGLTAPQILTAVDTLRTAGYLEAVDMLHVHLGSQVANVGDIRRGLQETARYYVELRRLGAPVSTVDVGGGLGVDYEGTRSRSFCSMNYSVREYAHNILRTLQQACAQAGEMEPDVISESGRALTAHHAVILTSIVDEDALPPAAAPVAPAADAPQVLHDFHAVLDYAADEPLETLHDAEALLNEARAQYVQGTLSLTQCAQAETMYYGIARAVQPLLDLSIRTHREAADLLAQKLAPKYFMNLSIFQSIPDAWAIDQVFPIVPLQRLDERPDVRATLCDLTCDSDGKLIHYVDREGLMPTLALHARRPSEDYLIGLFLVGAYQEILGDMHNLFGDTHAVNVVLDDIAPGGWRLDGIEPGDTAADLLHYVHLEPKNLAASYRRKLAATALPEDRKSQLLNELEAGLSGYTYLS